MKVQHRISPCFWFEGCAEEAARLKQAFDGK